MTTTRAICKALRVDGAPCRSWAAASGYCRAHDPAAAADVAEAGGGVAGRARPAHRRDGRRGASTHRRAGRCAGRDRRRSQRGLAAGKVAISGAAVGYLAGVFVADCFEVSELERRLAGLEASRHEQTLDGRLGRLEALRHASRRATVDAGRLAAGRVIAGRCAALAGSLAGDPGAAGGGGGGGAIGGGDRWDYARLAALEGKRGAELFVVQVQGLDAPGVYHGNGRAYTAAELSKLEAAGARVTILEIVRGVAPVATQKQSDVAGISHPHEI